MAISKEKAEILKKLQASQEKKYGEGKGIYKGSELPPTEFLSTGILGLDLALGGGIPIGRVIGISGSYSSCKTTTALTTISTQMKKDPDFICYYYDAENSFDSLYAESLGVDLDRIIVDNTPIAEEGLTKLRDSIATGIFNIAVLDSTNALSPSKDNNDDVSSTSMAMRARILGNAYPQLVGVCGSTRCTLIVIEQIRMAIGGYGNPEVTSVGKSGEFYFSQQLIMRRQTKVEEKEGVAISNEVKVKVKKNKVAPPFRTCELVCLYGKGFDSVVDVANLSTQLGVAEKKGSWIYYPTKDTCLDEHKFQGNEKFVNYLKNNEDFKEKIFNEVMEVYKNGNKASLMRDDDKTDEENMKAKELAELALSNEMSEVEE